MYGLSYRRSLFGSHYDAWSNDYLGATFDGTFDGNGRRISNLMIMGHGCDYVGLFSELDPNAVVQDLVLDNFMIAGEDYVGALAGRNDGTVVNVDVSVTIEGVDCLGGLVGYNAGAIMDSDVNLTLNKGRSAIGGVIGRNEPNKGIYENCSATIIILDYDAPEVGDIIGYESGTSTR